MVPKPWLGKHHDLSKNGYGASNRYLWAPEKQIVLTRAHVLARAGTGNYGPQLISIGSYGIP